MKEKIKLLKELYPDSLIYVLKKGKYYLNDVDKDIVKTFNKEIANTNYVILENLDIIDKKKYLNNNYNNLFLKTKLINIIKMYVNNYEKKN